MTSIRRVRCSLTTSSAISMPHRQRDCMAFVFPARSNCVLICARWGYRLQPMPIHSIEDDSGLHCVDFIDDEQAGVRFKVFRKDVEDEGKWMLVADYSNTVFASKAEALNAAAARIPWLREVLLQRGSD